MAGRSCQKYRLEKAYRESCMTLAETEANITMFNSMIRKKVPTTDIRQFAAKQAAQCRVHKQISQKIVHLAMKVKRADAIAFAKRLRRAKYRNKNILISCYQVKEKVRKVIHEINNKASEYKEWLRGEKRDKIEHLEAKYSTVNLTTKSLKSCPPGARELLQDLDIFNTQMSPEPPRGPMICHPDIKLSEEELQILNKGPKFMVRTQFDQDEFSLQMEKAIAKQNYDDIENGPKDTENDTNIGCKNEIDWLEDSEDKNIVNKIEAESKAMVVT